MIGPQTTVVPLARSAGTALQMGIPGTQEIVIIFMMLIFLAIPVLGVVALVYVLVNRGGESEEVERLENRVEELEAKLDEE